jgi:uncharacterized RDD family membrane protein YckC
VETDSGNERITFRAAALLDTGATSVAAVQCAIDEGFLTIHSITPLKIPLNAIETVSTALMAPVPANVPDQSAPLTRLEITYLDEDHKRWFVVLDFNRGDADRLLKILQAENVQINSQAESGRLTGKPAFRGKIYIPSADGRFEIAEISMGDGLFSIESTTPMVITFDKIESGKIITTKVRTGKKPDDVPLLMKTIELSYVAGIGEKQNLSFGIDTSDVETLSTVFEAQNIRFTQEERLDVRLEYAGFWRRFLAVLIDGIILNISTSVISFILLIIAAVIGISSRTEYGTAFWENSLFITQIFSILFYLFFWTKGGQTPGKMAMGVRIVKADGSKINFGRALLRYFGYLVDFPLTIGIGYFWIAWDRKKQGLHDKIAGTYVIKV